MILRLAAVIAFVAILAVATACGDDPGVADDGITIEPVGTMVSPTAVVVATQQVTGTIPPTNGSSEPHGFTYPIAGGCLPKGDQLMPNAPREYRNGIHEGVDFYNVDNCTPISVGTTIVAAKAGTVIRADLDYHNLTPQELANLQANPGTEEGLDLYRGRQVWIDHGGGVVTRYAHLSAIAPGIARGSIVSQGQAIGAVGESGTPESISSTGSEYHLHFEIRLGPGCVAASAAATVNCSFLGKGQPPAIVRGLYLTAFGP